MIVICTVPLLLIIGACLIAVRENIDEAGKKEKILIPFFKAVKRLSRISFISRLISLWIAHNVEKYEPLYGEKEALRETRFRCYKTIASGLFIISVACVLGIIISLSEGDNSIKSLSRLLPGEGEIVYEIQAEIGQDRREIPISISEREYSEEEIKELFKYGDEHIEELILADNKSLDEVYSNLNLITKLPDTDISINWESDNYSVLQPSGELIKENVQEGGTTVNLTAIFTYGEFSQEKNIEITIIKKYIEGTDGRFEALDESIKKGEAADKTSDTYTLPDEIMGEDVRYYENNSRSGLVILLLSIAVVVLLPFEEKSVLDKKIEKRKNEMILDYPELVYKLSLYMGAGMTVSSAWERIALSYVERKKESAFKRFCNEEVLYTYRQLQTGMLKSKAFEEFGNRCRIQMYKKLSLLINSNIKKGSADLSEILLTESQEAMENRKSSVIKLANEASAKLMLPMLLELVVVIGVLVIPAFMSMKF